MPDVSESPGADGGGPLSNGNGNGNGHVSRPAPTAQDLLQRCQTLLSELEDFKEYLKGRRQENAVEIAHFRNTVRSEHRTLERLSSALADDADSTQHTVNSSNLPFLETVWNTVKISTGLTALQKRFYWTEDGAKMKPGGGGRGNKKQLSALVDIVTDDGRQWTKVSLLTNTRLLFDKAKQGWEDASSDEDGEDGAPPPTHDGENDVPLVRMAKDLVRASRATRIRTRHPAVTLMLPKIVEHVEPAIDAILASLRSLGCNVLTSDRAPRSVSLAASLPTLLTSPHATLTPRLNIDCTILLALVSDFSHVQVAPEPWFHTALKRQLDIENDENLLPSLLYPALAGRELVCTAEAARRMHDIVDTIGTPGEKARTSVLMGTAAAGPDPDPHAALEPHSRFPVPRRLLLPIRTQEPDLDAAAAAAALPPSAAVVRDALTSINQSVFLHGWAAGMTTVTSNRTVVKQIESLLQGVAESDDEWPLIWLCPTARSLVGKEKGRRE